MIKLLKRNFHIVIIALVAFLGGSILTAATDAAQSLAARLAGRILLQVESKGEAWYVEPQTLERYYLGRPHDCFDLMRGRGLGVKTMDLNQIPLAADSKIPNLTQDWKTYNANFQDPNAGMQNISFKYPPYLYANVYATSEGKLPKGCVNCSAKTTLLTIGPGFFISDLTITQSQANLTVDTALVNYEYEIKKSATDNSFVTIKIIKHNETPYPGRLQAVTTQPIDGIYYKFDLPFTPVVLNINLEQAQQTFQEILNSIRFQE